MPLTCVMNAQKIILTDFDAMSRTTIVTVTGMTLVRSTDKAGCYRDEDGDEYWFPWSQVMEGSVDRDGDTGDLLIPRWLADEKGVAYEYEE